MLGSIFSSLGGALGGAFGGGILSTIGRFAGKMLGNYLDRSITGPEENYAFRNIKESFKLNCASYGDSIPLVFGKVKIKGKVIWSDRIKKNIIDNEKRTYFSDTKQVKRINHAIEYEYTLSFAVAICEGEIKEIDRVWANSELINLENYRFRIYKGSEEQLADTLIQSIQGKAPAFRGISYIVFEDLPLVDFGDMVPNFEFEVSRIANLPSCVANIPVVESMVKSMVLIPGSGEFVYDTVVQYKIIKNDIGDIVSKEAINLHNRYKVANACRSLDQLQETCQNLKWTALVSCWFGNSTDAEFCSIVPGVEYQDDYASTTEEWKVGEYNRKTARLIKRNQFENLQYGGSVNDASVVRYLQEIKSRGIKVMFYPMIFLDVEQKPWRGHITGTANAIITFFNKPDGYNNFILHYARLVRDNVDAFVIGSELIGLTKVRHQDEFPAVVELIKLARLVRQILPSNVKITYAADWSEYHHTEGGWYNLDSLWASNDIDFIGIDSYFPVTSTLSSSVSKEEIIRGWQSGEGYEYYIDQGIKKSLDPKYAWKNIEYWWSNYHVNPSGEQTSWRPKMKKIWFTEFGFPSIDKATNQPNVFFDPLCRDGGVPKHSSGAVDFSIQRKAIKYFIEYWESVGYVENMFLWCWDARPYPAWPHTKVWTDGYLWECGHWVNDKFNSSNLASIILEISNKCGVHLESIDVSSLDEVIDGMVISTKLAGIDVINLLRIGYFFDIVSIADKIAFIKRGIQQTQVIDPSYLLELTDNTYFSKYQIDTDSIISKIGIHYISVYKSYEIGYIQVNNEHLSSASTNIIKLPIVMSDIDAERLGFMILKNASSETHVVVFSIPIWYNFLVPSNMISIEYLGRQNKIRIINVKWNGIVQEITGIFDDTMSYNIPSISNNLNLVFENAESKLIVLDLPFGLKETNLNYLAFYFKNDLPDSLYAAVDYGLDELKFNKIAQLINGQIGVLMDMNLSLDSSIFLIDEISTFNVKYKNLHQTAKNGDWNLAMCGSEILRFKYYKQINEELYQINHLIRGDYATEKYLNVHSVGEDFILLEHGVNIVPVSEKLKSMCVHFKTPSSDIQKIVFEGKSQKPLQPFIINGQEYQRQEVW